MQLTKEEAKELIELKLNDLEKTFGKPARLIALEILTLANNPKKQTRYIEVTQWNIYHPYPSVSGLRNKINRSKYNGFDEYNVVHRQDGRVFINENNYFKWFSCYKKNSIYPHP